MRLLNPRPALALFAPWLLLVLLGACAVPGPAQKIVSDWHDAVVAVREQSNTTFRGVNELTREAQVKRAAMLPILKEDEFRKGLDSESLAIWNRSLDSLASYGAALSALLNPAGATAVGNAAKGAAESIATTAKSDLLTKRPGLAGALGSLATKLAAQSAGRHAREIMVETDPAVGDVLNQMAEMLGDDATAPTSAVRATVHANWTTQAAEFRAEFLKPGADKLKVAGQYASMLDKRDAADIALLGLRRSLLQLRVAHGKAAAGEMDASATIANVREQILFVKSLVAGLKPAAS